MVYKLLAQSLKGANDNLTPIYKHEICMIATARLINIRISRAIH